LQRAGKLRRVTRLSGKIHIASEEGRKFQRGKGYSPERGVGGLVGKKKRRKKKRERKEGKGSFSRGQVDGVRLPARGRNHSLLDAERTAKNKGRTGNVS